MHRVFVIDLTSSDLLNNRKITVSNYVSKDINKVQKLNLTKLRLVLFTIYFIYLRLALYESQFVEIVLPCLVRIIFAITHAFLFAEFTPGSLSVGS